jgi:hypothetical protein
MKPFFGLFLMMSVMLSPIPAIAQGAIEVGGRLSARQAYSHFVRVQRGQTVYARITLVVARYGGLVSLVFMNDGSMVRAVSALVGVNDLNLSRTYDTYLFADPNSVSVVRNDKPFIPSRNIRQLFRNGLVLPEGRYAIYVNVKVTPFK